MRCLQRKSAKTSRLEKESPESKVPTDRILATDSLVSGSTQGPVLYCSGPRAVPLHWSRGRALPAQKCRLLALDGLAAGSRKSLHAGLLDLAKASAKAEAQACSPAIIIKSRAFPTFLPPREQPDPLRRKLGALTLIFIAALFTIARTWKQPRSPSTEGWIKKVWYIYIYI